MRERTLVSPPVGGVVIRVRGGEGTFLPPLQHTAGGYFLTPLGAPGEEPSA